MIEYWKFMVSLRSAFSIKIDYDFGNLLRDTFFLAPCMKLHLLQSRDICENIKFPSRLNRPFFWPAAWLIWDSGLFRTLEQHQIGVNLKPGGLKSQIPSTKWQANSKFKYPNLKRYPMEVVWDFGFGSLWFACFLGFVIWCFPWISKLYPEVSFLINLAAFQASGWADTGLSHYLWIWIPGISRHLLSTNLEKNHH